MIWNREEYIAHMTFQYTGREMFTELFGPLGALDKEWIAAGVSEKERNLSAFGMDNVKYVDLKKIANTHSVSGITPKVLVDNENETILIDELGRKSRLCKASATIPLPLDHPVQTPEDWEKIKHWYEFSEDRIDYEKLKEAKKLQQEGYLIIAWMPGGFDEPRELMGEADLCYAFYDEPEMIEDMLDTMANTTLKVFERVSDYLTIDNLAVHEDLAGKSGPLVGPKQIKQFITPYYQRIWNEVKRNGGKLFSQDSDGNMNAVIDDFLDAGINVMYPFEPGSGMDMVESRKKYGNRLAIKGGIDKYTLRAGKDEIRRELEYKMCEAMKGGGTAFALDHRIPNGVSIENYRYYVKLGRELLGLPEATESPFVRMAF